MMNGFLGSEEIVPWSAPPLTHTHTHTHTHTRSFSHLTGQNGISTHMKPSLASKAWVSVWVQINLPRAWTWESQRQGLPKEYQMHVSVFVVKMGENTTFFITTSSRHETLKNNQAIVYFEPFQTWRMMFFKKLKTTTIWSSNSTSGYICRRIKTRDSNRYLYTYIRSSIIHNSQKVEATQVSTDMSR